MKNTYIPASELIKKRKNINPSRAWCGFCKRLTYRDKNYKCESCK